ncbi:MAG: prolyl oligopeptidase family serine peptidase [Saprospiraceae bacterium]
MPTKTLLGVVFLFLFFLSPINAQQDKGYQTPPAAITDLINAPQTPDVSINSSGEWIMLMENPGYPSIEQLAQEELRLAGLRINPRTNSASRSNSYVGLKLKNIGTGKEFALKGLPDQLEIENASWSPDGQKMAFTNTTATGLELWVVDVKTQTAKALTGPIINDAMNGLPFDWLSDNTTIIAKTILENRGAVPTPPLVPAGPIVQQTSGKEAPVRTYQDLLKSPFHEALFEYYASSQLVSIHIQTGKTKNIGIPGIHSEVSPSPDGKYLLVATVNRPFSYIVPYSRFPTVYNMFDTNGKMVMKVADIPLAENIPKGFGAVRMGPRSFSWRADAPSSLYWVEAMDEGDPKKEVAVRDQLYYMEPPFNGKKRTSIGLKFRYSGVLWGNDTLAIAYESWWSTREQLASRFSPTQADSKVILFETSSEDAYNDPGDFATTDNQYGRNVLLTDKAVKKLYLTGLGASAEGNRPFVREFDLESKTFKEHWRSAAPYYEFPVKVLDIDKGIVLTRRESTTEPPNYFLRNLQSGKLQMLTNFDHPYPGLKGVEKQSIAFKRADGLDLQGDLYLPKGYDPAKEDPLPVLMWAYPREYKSADAAMQVSGSPYSFIRLSWGSPLYWVTRGYAVFDRVSMPIIGEGDEEPNDSFREQLVANAKAAVDKLVDMDIADPTKIGVGGHSYGAFMTANLLAHSDLFAAGIARSGAYNRTLTPFGFQMEERTYWEAPDLYNSMSPFMHADKINEPLLMIHGQADNNSGTFPIQSERLYSAIKGLGGTARLVLLPNESHGYAAKESILHCLWEMDQWMEKYVKRQATP